MSIIRIMGALELSGGRPLLVVGARARACRGFGTVADGDGWELWAAADDPRSVRRIAPEGDGVRTEQEAGNTVHRWQTAEGHVTARVWGPGTSGSRFVQANADAPTLMSPAGPASIARPASLMLIARASLTEPADWLSRMREYHELRLRAVDADCSPLERAAFELRCAEIAAHAEPVHRVSMRVPNDAFFGSFKYNIRLYEHDDLHRATCYYDVPLYLKLKDDPELAYIPRRNFERLDHQDRVRLVREECFAIALERVVIPAEALGIHCRPEDAHLYALHRVCTDLATGWFRDFAIEAFADAECLDTDYVERFHDAARTGRARARHDGPLPADVRQAMIGFLDRVGRRQRLAGLPGAMPGIAGTEAAAARPSSGAGATVFAG
jgi:hypothetical protein